MPRDARGDWIIDPSTTDPDNIPVGPSPNFSVDRTAKPPAKLGLSSPIESSPIVNVNSPIATEDFYSSIGTNSDIGGQAASQEDFYSNIGKAPLSFTQPALPKAPDRSIAMEPVTATIAGITDLAEQFARAYRSGAVEDDESYLGSFANWLIENKQKFEESHPYLYAPVKDEGEARRWIREGVRAVVPSLGAGLPGAAAGAVSGSLIGGPVGTGVGAVAGFALSGGTIFGLAEYDQFVQDVKEFNAKNPDKAIPEDVYKSEAFKSAIVEGGLEGLSDLIEGATFKLGGLITKPVKDSVKSILKEGWKGAAKDFVKRQMATQPAEILTEMGQNSYETWARANLGLEQPQSPLDAALGSIGPTFVSTLLMGAAFKTIDARKRGKIMQALMDPETDFDTRFDAMRTVYQELKADDKVNGTNLAEKWGTVAEYKLAKNEPIDIDESLTQMRPLEGLLESREKAAELDAAVQRFEERQKPEEAEVSVDIERPEVDKTVRQTMGLETRQLIYDKFIEQGFSEERANELATLVMGAKGPEAAPVKTRPSVIVDEFGKPVEVAVASTEKLDEKLTTGQRTLATLPTKLRESLVLSSQKKPFSSIGALKTVLKKNKLEDKILPIMIGDKEYVGALRAFVEMAARFPKIERPGLVTPTGLPQKQEVVEEKKPITSKGKLISEEIKRKKAFIKKGYSFANAVTDLASENPQKTTNAITALKEGLTAKTFTPDQLRHHINNGLFEALPGENDRQKRISDNVLAQVLPKEEEQPPTREQIEALKKQQGQEPEVTPEQLKELQVKLEEQKKELEATKEKLNDRTNKERVPGEKREGKEPQQAKPVEGTGKKSATAGGVVQEPSKTEEVRKGESGNKPTQEPVKVEEKKPEPVEPKTAKEKLTAAKVVARLKKGEDVPDADVKKFRTVAIRWDRNPDTGKWEEHEPGYLASTPAAVVAKEKKEVAEVEKRQKRVIRTPLESDIKKETERRAKSKKEQLDKLVKRQEKETDPDAKAELDEQVEQLRDDVHALENIVEKGQETDNRWFDLQGDISKAEKHPLFNEPQFMTQELVDKQIGEYAEKSKELNRWMLKKMEPEKAPKTFVVLMNYALHHYDGTVDLESVKAWMMQLNNNIGRLNVEPDVKVSILNDNKEAQDYYVKVIDYLNKNGEALARENEKIAQQEKSKIEMIKEAARRAKEKAEAPRPGEDVPLAVKLKDGTIVQDDVATDHNALIVDNELKAEDVTERGYFDEGKFITTEEYFNKYGEKEFKGIENIKLPKRKFPYSFSRVEDNSLGRGMSIMAVREAADKLLPGFKKRPSIVVVPDRQSLPDYMKEFFAGTPDHVRIGGALYGNTAYLIAKELKNEHDVQRVLIHEVIGHYGIRNTLGAGGDRMMKVVYDRFANTSEMQKILKTYSLNKNNEKDQLTAGAEFLAKMAETNKFAPSLWRDIIDTVKKILNQMGFNFKMPDRLIKSLIADSYKFVEGNFHSPHISLAFQTRKVSQQREDYADPLYSQLIKVVRDNLQTMPKKTQSLRNWLNKSVKPAELRWMNVEEYFKGKDIIDREDFLKFIEANKIQIDEVLRGQETNQPLQPLTGAELLELENLREANNAGGFISTEPELNIDNGFWHVDILDSEGNGISGHDFNTKKEADDFADEETARLNHDIARRITELENREQGQNRQPFTQHQINLQNSIAAIPDSGIGNEKYRIFKTDDDSILIVTYDNFDAVLDSVDVGNFEEVRQYLEERDLDTGPVNDFLGELAIDQNNEAPQQRTYTVHDIDETTNDRGEIQGQLTTFYFNVAKEPNGEFSVLWFAGEDDTPLDSNNFSSFEDAIEAARNQIVDMANNPGAYIETPEDVEHYRAWRASFLPTRYDQYTEKGGKNYRELLLQWYPKNVDELPEHRINFINESTYPYQLEINDYGTWKDVQGYATKPTDIEIKSEIVKWLEDRGRRTNYFSPHWDERNVLAHLRFSERKDSSGKPIMFIEEIQSDWLQKAKKEGFRQELTEEDKKHLFSLQERNQELTGLIRDLEREQDNYVAREYEKDYETYGRNPRTIRTLGLEFRQKTNEGIQLAAYKSERIQNENQIERLTRPQDAVPKAPFLENWHEMVMKRALRWAAENKFEGVAWTTGQQQITRYKNALTQVIDTVRYIPQPRAANNEQTYEVLLFKDGRRVDAPRNANMDFRFMTEANLRDMFSDEIADRIIKGKADASAGDYSDIHTGEIEIGGKGMRVFYDERLKAFTERYVKQWGGKLETINLSNLSNENKIKNLIWLTGPDMGESFPIGTIAATTYEGIDTQFYIKQDVSPEQVILYRATDQDKIEGFFDNIDDAKAEAQRLYDLVAGKLTDIKKFDQPGFYLTPQMKEDVLWKGQPLFSKTSEPTQKTKLHEFERAIIAYHYTDNKPDTGFMLTNGKTIPLEKDENGELAGTHEGFIEEVINWSPNKKASKKMLSDYKKARDINYSPTLSYVMNKTGILRTIKEGNKLYVEFVGRNKITPEQMTVLHSLEQSGTKIVFDHTDLNGNVIESGEGLNNLLSSEAPQFSKTEEPEAVRIPDYTDAENQTRKETRELFTETSRAILKTLAQQLPKNQPAMNVWARYLLSPEWYDHPVLSNIVKAAINRHDRYYDLFNTLNDISKPVDGQDNVIDLNVQLRNKGLTSGQIVLGKVSDDYKAFEKIVDEGDTLEWQKQYPSGTMPTYEQHLVNIGTPEDLRKLYSLHRQAYDKALDLLIGPMQKLVKNIDDEAAKNKEKPKYPEFNTLDEEGKPTKINLKQVIQQMGQLRGTYAPRLREIGQWVVKGKRGEKVVRYHKPNRLSAELLKKELESKGYTIEPIHERERLPEDVYSTLRVVNTAKAIETAMTGADYNNPELQNKFHEALLQDVADLIRVRGFRSSMVSRKTGPVIRGYITDPNERFVRYINNISAGIAKAEAAEKMFKELTGRFEGQGPDRKRVSGIDPIKEPRAYDTATNYITEQLRNADAVDRLVGFVKSVATFKYLGFSIRSPLVNILALPTTAPVAIHQYALDGKGSMVTIGKELAKASGDYMKVLTRKNHKLDNKDEQAFIDEIHQKGYDTPQYTRDALGTIQRTHGKAWTKAMYWAMYIFGKSEQWIRGATMLAAYRLAKSKNPDMSHDQLAEKAHNASDKAHGIYGKATQLAVGQGTGPGARLAQILYTYQKFGHNYLQLLYDTGIRKGNVTAFMYGLLAPVIIGGASVIPFKDFFFKLLGGILSMLGVKWEPEKAFWDWVRKQFGTTTERVGRHGALGAANIDVSSSMSIGVGVPKDFFELMGVGGGIMKDYLDAKHFLEIGQPERAVEKALPTSMGNIFKAIRELNGVTTTKGQRVWNEKGEPYVPSAVETGLRVTGFRSAAESTMAERTYETKREVTNYATERNKILEAFREYVVSKGDQKDLQKVMDKVMKYNSLVIKEGKAGEIPLITQEVLRSQARSLTKPSRSMYLGLFNQ